MPTTPQQDKIDIHTRTDHVWGHIGDIITAHKDADPLLGIVTDLLDKLTRAGWILNLKKTILKPQTTLSFLGAIWSQTDVRRDPKLKYELQRVIATNTKKETQKIRGYLNYYLSFAGKVHTIINRVIKESKGKHFLCTLLEEDRIKFRDPDTSKEKAIFTEATTMRIGWTKGYSGHIMRTWPLPIIVTETLASLVGVYSVMKTGASKIRLFTDNMATAFFIKRGSGGFLYNIILNFIALFVREL